MADEVDLYKDVDKIPKYEDFEPLSSTFKDTQIKTSSVSIFFGNLTWWTSDFDLEMAREQSWNYPQSGSSETEHA